MLRSNAIPATATEQKGISITCRGAITYLAPRVSLIEEGGLKVLQETLAGCIAEGKLQLILDFTMVASLNSKALGCLLDNQARLARKGGWIKISNASSTMMERGAI